MRSPWDAAKLYAVISLRLLFQMRYSIHILSLYLCWGSTLNSRRALICLELVTSDGYIIVRSFG